ncbi:MAG: serine/threonine-protein kinase [Minicystis sp.]
MEPHDPTPFDPTHAGCTLRRVEPEIERAPAARAVVTAKDHADSLPFTETAMMTAHAAVTEPPSVSTEPEPTALPFPVLDEYRIIKHLGSGGMGDVYLAHDASLDRLVALKFIRDVDDRPDSRRRFLVEARATARLQHPNVLTVHRVGELDRRPYLVTEYIEGKGLDRISKPMSSRRALEIGLGLARGLAEAHRHGVLHRDIKPSNAIVGKDGRVKLVDFGLAKLVKGASPSSKFRQLVKTSAPAASIPPPRLDAAPAGPTSLGGAAQLTDSGAMLGTPAYMAPEIWSGESATERSDIYSLGALLFELLTGEPPHKGVPPIERKNREAPSLAAILPALDRRFAAIVERCLRKDPSERYATGDGLRQALEALERSRDRAGEPAAATLRSWAGDLGGDDLGDASDAFARRAAPPPGNPYRGLRTFEAEHRALFFGRRAEVGTLLGRLRGESMVVVVGEYAVGKSSLCRAGVLPAVEEGALRENRAWTVARVVPGPTPLFALGAALAPTLGMDASRVVRQMRARPGAIAELLRARLGHRAGVVIFVDQLEELVTIGDRESATIIDEVLGQLALGVPGVRLLMTLRAAFLDAVSVFPWLGEQLGRASYLLKPMSPEGVREAIIGPAALAGVGFDATALVESLVEETLHSEWGLPLLQFMLAALWDARDPATGTITDAAMERVGYGASALARHADEVIRAMSQEQRAAARRVLTKLSNGEAGPVRCREDELVIGDPVERIALHELVRGRLVAVRGAEVGVTYELSHLALREEWELLRRWRGEPTEGELVLLRLQAAAVQWEVDHARIGLWSARQLADLHAVDPESLREPERKFIAASRREVRRARLARKLSRALISLAESVVGPPGSSSRPSTSRGSNRR